MKKKDEKKEITLMDIKKGQDYLAFSIICLTGVLLLILVKVYI